MTRTAALGALEPFGYLPLDPGVGLGAGVDKADLEPVGEYAERNAGILEEGDEVRVRMVPTATAHVAGEIQHDQESGWAAR